ncbi:uncharacterized protein LOC125178825 [Hyalella azteca]|uniref:Uncharacterized protein LOC125178825 n=1 Tax=Hyalella azteca TaxID=294128 RepID=A0A979FQS1_HYAAZ|nr:uncharacterized protein LOC125178825 [Hyalella azteca]
MRLLLLCLLVVGTAWGTHLMYRVHFRNACLCPAFIRSSLRTGSAARCATYASAESSPAFVFCEGEAADCSLATSNYTVGTWISSGQSCLLYSSYPPPPPPPPQPQGTKLFKLSAATTSARSMTSLSGQDLCAAEGLQLAVVTSAAEQQQVHDQVGAEILRRCYNMCLAWFWLDSSLHWADGSLLNQCQVTIKNPGSTPACFYQDYGTTGLFRYPCTIEALPVVCQTYQ